MWWLFSFTPLVYVAFAMQLTLAPRLAIKGCAPQFVLLVVMLVVPRMSGVAGLLAAASCGLLADCLASTGLGVDLVCFTWAAFFAQRAAQYLNPRRPIVAGAVVAASVAVLTGVSAIARLWLSRQQIDFGEISLVSFGSGIYTGAVAAVLLLPLRLLPYSQAASISQHHTERVANRWKMLTN